MKTELKSIKNLDLKGIPFGPMTMEQLIESPEGREVIRLLKQKSDDPLKLIVPFVVSYQYYAMLAQLKGRVIHLTKQPEFTDALLDVATRYVIENLSDIVHEIGEERLNNVVKILSPEEDTAT